MRPFLLPLLAVTVTACGDGALLSASGASDTATSDTLTPDASDTLTPDTAAPDTTTSDTATPDTFTPDAADTADTLTPDLPRLEGTADGDALIFDRRALEDRLVYGIGADPNGLLAMLGGGAAGLAPTPATVVFVPDGSGGGVAEIRALSSSGAAIMNARGLLESYPYTDLPDGQVRLDFSAPLAPFTLALNGNCGYTRASYALHAPPRFADALLTWPANEALTRTGTACNWAPAQARGLHVHYLRHSKANTTYPARTAESNAPFGFFESGSARAPVITRLPGVATDDVPQTLTYYLSSSFPEARIPAAQQTFEAWNDALEATVGRRPFVVARATPDMIAWDPRFRMVLWDASGSDGAVAPFAEDPVTGEIFQSFVVLWLGKLDDMVTRYTEFFDAHPDLRDALPPLPNGPAALIESPMSEAAREAFAALERRTIGRATRPAELEPNILSLRRFTRRPLDRAAFASLDAYRQRLGRSLTPDEVSDVILIDFLLHELGHNLGLRHNFIASADLHREQPHDTATSTMDYVIGMLTPGSYDRDALRYAYSDAPPTRTDYLYCTDEMTERDAACIPWDFGSPLAYQHALVAALLAETPPTSSAQAVSRVLRQGQLDAELTRLRSFLNTPWETWGEDPFLSTFDLFLEALDCGDACSTHPTLRAQLALYLLFTRHQVTAWWLPNYPDIWLDFPALTETQAALVGDALFALITDPAEPLAVKTPIIAKLPTSSVPGMPALLTQLADHFTALPSPTPDDQALLDAILAATPSP